MDAGRFDALTRRLAAAGSDWPMVAWTQANDGQERAERADACCVYSCASMVTSFTTVTCHVGACPPIAGCVLTGTGVCQECGPALQ